MIVVYPVLADEDYRPEYPFSDVVFEELPSFPEDFDEVVSLFLDRKVSAWHLSEEYFLQPEFIETWDYWSTEVYGRNKSRFGIYGASFFPSHLTFFNVAKGDVINVSGFIKADWGIQYLQGCSIYIPEVKGLDIELVYPERELLLQPTYPKFKNGWIQKFLIRVTVLETDNYSFKVFEGVPSNYTDAVWKGLYGADYVSLGSLVRLSMTIDMNMPEHQQGGNDKSVLPYVASFFIVLLVIAWVITYLLRKYDAKRKGDKQ